MLVAVATNEKR
jgi:hypothetical protein